MSEVSDVEVIVAGGGSVGLAAAAALSGAGFSVQLVERAAPPVAVPGEEVDARVYALSARSMRFLDQLGVWPTIASVRACAYQGMAVWHNDPARALRFAAPPGEPLGWIVEHRVLNAALWAQVGNWQRRSGDTITSAHADESGVVVQLSTGDHLRARLLVIADGPDSPLRRQLGMDSVGWHYPQRALVSHLRFERPHGGVARQRFLPGGPLALLPLADGRCSMVWSCGAVDADALQAASPEAFRQQLSTMTQGVLGALLDHTLLRSFPLRLSHVPEPSQPGAIAIGDAAHVVHPLAGQGVNLGMADAQELAAVLGAARAAGRGWWRPRTLSAYVRQRHADTLDMLAMTDGLHRLFTGSATLAQLAGQGLSAIDRLDPVKHWLGARAQG